MVHKSTKILLTGATGFLGSHILEFLLTEQYTNIHLIIRPGRAHLLSKNCLSATTIHEGDLLDVVFVDSACQGVDIIMHAAALVSFEGKANEIIQKNVRATANLVDMALRNLCKHFIHISSVATLSKPQHKAFFLIDEKQQWSTTGYNSPYAWSKYLSELEVWRGYHEGLQTTVLLPSLIVGKHHRYDTSSLVWIDNMIKGNRYYPMGSNGFVDVEDVVKAVDLCMASDFSGKKYIISSENMSYEQYVKLIAQELGLSQPLKPFNGWKQQCWSFLLKLNKFSLKRPTKLTEDAIKNTSLLAAYNNSASISELGMSYRPIKETLASIADQIAKR